MMDINKINQLLEIAEKSIEADRLRWNAKHAKHDLNEAYDTFKQEIGVDHIEIPSADWENMKAAIKGLYDASEEAKRIAYNAKRRLESAIQRYREGGAA